MRIVNIMNFVRQCDPRMEDSERILFETAKKQVALIRKSGLENTFLLQYDALIDPRYQELFQTQADEHMELGLWYEIVKPLCDKVGIPWRGREGWSWDWHVVPGFSMAYTCQERKRLIDIAMEDFKRIYGFYPETVGSWLIDGYTVKYLVNHYPVKAFCICRDQTETDAYTLVGGYFNQGYYPSVNNVLTPAQTEENQIPVPVFRLLGPDPIHSYDKDKYLTDMRYLPYKGCFTLEPIWRSGSDPDLIKWFMDLYFTGEDLGFSYAQLGQENSFGPDLLPGLALQLKMLSGYPEVHAWKMSKTGEWFRQKYPSGTPATCVCALTDWDNTNDIQSVYYDCRYYTANLFRCGGRIFLRELYLFDENAEEYYLHTPCTTWDAVYENLPVVDTLLWRGSTGMTLDHKGSAFCVSCVREGELLVSWGDREVLFTENGIILRGIRCIQLDWTGSNASPERCGREIIYHFKGHSYALTVLGASAAEKKNACVFAAENEKITLRFKTGLERERAI